jgi:hypothetical protein
VLISCVNPPSKHLFSRLFPDVITTHSSLFFFYCFLQGLGLYATPAHRVHRLLRKYLLLNPIFTSLVTEKRDWTAEGGDLFYETVSATTKAER